MTGRWLPVSFLGLALSLLVFGFFTPVPAPLAYLGAFVVAALAGGARFCLDRRPRKRR